MEDPNSIRLLIISTKNKCFIAQQWDLAKLPSPIRYLRLFCTAPIDIPHKTWKNLTPPRTAPTKVCYFFETDPNDRPHLTW